jgi:hypothetical protein
MLILNSGKVSAETPEEVARLAALVCDTVADGIQIRH